MSPRVTSETELIAHYLAPLSRGAAGALDLQDDAAFVSPLADHDLVVTTDPVIAGVHFFADEDPADIAWRAQAVNLSDLAAKGAEPLAYTMALALPEAPTHAWMARFAFGLGEAQAAFGWHLIGGDTDRTPGPLSISITAIGQVPSGRMIRRTTASAGNHVFVTGTIGDGALGLDVRRNADWSTKLSMAHRHDLRGRYLCPQPRLTLRAVLRRYATAALDISDGLVKDAGRLCGALALEIAVDRVPLSEAARAAIALKPDLIESALTGGDDYEVLFAVKSEDAVGLIADAAQTGVPVTELGVLQATAGGVIVRDNRGQIIRFAQTGHAHF